MGMWRGAGCGRSAGCGGVRLPRHWLCPTSWSNPFFVSLPQNLHPRLLPPLRAAAQREAAKAVVVSRQLERQLARLQGKRGQEEASRCGGGGGWRAESLRTARRVYRHRVCHIAHRCHRTCHYLSSHEV